MLDIKVIRDDFDSIKRKIEFRGQGDFDIDKVIELDLSRREMLADVEAKKNRQNTASKEIPMLKKEGKDVGPLMMELKTLSDEIKQMDNEVSRVESDLRNLLLNIPNVPNEKVPAGSCDEDNVEIRRWGEPTKVDFKQKAHWDVGTDLGILDFERATKVAGTRFTVYKGLGARLERSVMNFMLDLHTKEHGFTEVLPPFMVNRDAMTGTGQLPKFEEDMFHIPAKDFYLIPTAEVPITNLLMNEILDGHQLPIYYTAYTPCFRKEAGSAGRDTRGLIRQHQFNKVELVKFTKPEDSYEELEALTAAAEKVLKLLKIPYRVVRLCAGDLGFSSAMTYDIEVWMPSYERYVEISSCSNFESYQARRANIRFRREPKGRPEFVHTLNGSGLAVGRTTAAILENYQLEDGSVLVPKVLQPYMGTDVIKNG
ncbi:MAG TPA: serine--tRNA ligase [Anaerovoracaceae bacterium]|nr:serine--tRNA ligase [Anaerovoracaceae bacterium]